jgi:N-acetyl-beta-hexosaminidase
VYTRERVVEAVWLARALELSTMQEEDMGFPEDDYGCIVLRINKKEPALQDNLVALDEAYTLSVGHGGRVGGSAVGVFYGVQSLLQLVHLPALRIVNAPRFPYLGLMVDIARNFFGLVTLCKTIDVMAAYKLNVLHLHLADDEGWRLEIDGLEELTAVGGRRCTSCRPSSPCTRYTHPMLYVALIIMYCNTSTRGDFDL